MACMISMFIMVHYFVVSFHVAIKTLKIVTVDRQHFQKQLC